MRLLADSLDQARDVVLPPLNELLVVFAALTAVARPLLHLRADVELEGLPRGGTVVGVGARVADVVEVDAVNGVLLHDFQEGIALHIEVLADMRRKVFGLRAIQVHLRAPRILHLLNKGRWSAVPHVPADVPDVQLHTIFAARLQALLNLVAALIDIGMDGQNLALVVRHV